ncbi:MAG: hypothetical protein OXU68_00770 [Bacteroidota bacterium]|nr:hypothetical protein [Bacteroidota bacterium]MDE2955532.1 hypothetical protein [Bacteroidota bacterium]
MRPGAAFLLLTFGLLGCEAPAEEESYVARVGDEVLTHTSLQSSLASLAVGLDTEEVARQLIDRWITSELLYQEARRLRIETRPEIREQLRQSERAVLIQSMVEMYQMEESSAQSALEISAYFESHKENMRLLEPFVRVRHFPLTDPDSAALAAQMLNRSPEADSVFEFLAVRFAADPSIAIMHSQNFYPERNLFTTRPALRRELAALIPGSPARVMAADSTWHLVQLMDRAVEGSLPELVWVEDHVRQQLQIARRKQNYAAAVQRLRSEADTRDEIEIRY